MYILCKYYLYVLCKGAVGAGVNVKDFDPKAPCSIPCRGRAIAGLSFLTPKNECVPGRMCVILPDCAQCQLQSLQLFLVSCRFTVSFPEGRSCLCARWNRSSRPYSGIPTVLAPWSVRNQLPLKNTDHASGPGDPIRGRTQATKGSTLWRGDVLEG